MKNHFTSIIYILFISLILVACSSSTDSDDNQSDSTKTDSSENIKIKGVELKFAKKWKIITHIHPGATEQGVKASENEYLYLNKDATYELNTYNYKEQGTWRIVMPHPYRYEGMDNIDLSIPKDEEVLELKPSEKSKPTRQDRAYLLKIEKDKLSAVATYDPTAFEAIEIK
jgi:hypothetical protein